MIIIAITRTKNLDLIGSSKVISDPSSLENISLIALIENNNGKFCCTKLEDENL